MTKILYALHSKTNGFLIEAPDLFGFKYAADVRDASLFKHYGDAEMAYARINGGRSLPISIVSVIVRMEAVL